MGKVLFFMGKGRSAFGASPFFAISVKQSLTEPSAFGFFLWEKGEATKSLRPSSLKKDGKK
jgi:hypothetical protein